MKELIDHLGDRIRELMVGRYGVDDLSKCLMTVTLILFILSLFVRNKMLYLAALVVCFYTWYRMLSEQFQQREKENAIYQRVRASMKKLLKAQKRRIDGSRDFCFFTCPGCGQEVRVPRGKGRIRITCPKCRTQFDRTV